MHDVATILCIILIVGLFWLDRGSDAPASKGFWLVLVYLLLADSRALSIWLGISPPAGSNVYVEGSPVDRAAGIVFVVAALWIAISRRDRTGPLLRDNRAVLLFFAFALLSVAWSDYPFVTFKHWVKAVNDVAMVLIMVTEIDPVAAIRRLLKTCAFILIPLSLLFCKYYPEIGWKLSKGFALLYTGVTTDKNELGLICVVFGLSSLWCLLAAWRDRGGAGRGRRLLAHATVLGICAWLLRLCNSMTSITSLAMIGVVLILIGRSSDARKSSAVNLAVAAIVGMSLFAIFGSGGGLLRDLGRNPTLTGRTDVWHDCLQIPNNSIIGTGYESFWLGHRLIEIRQLAGFNVNEAHNGYLEMYLNLGWAGVSLLALMIGAGYRKLILAYRRSPELGSLCLALFLAGTFHGLTEAAFRMQTPSWIFFLWAIFAASLIVQRASQTPFESGWSAAAPSGEQDFAVRQADSLLPDSPW